MANLYEVHHIDQRLHSIKNKLNPVFFVISSCGHISYDTPRLAAVQIRGDSLDQGLHHHHLLSLLLLRGHGLGHLLLLVLHLISPEPVLVKYGKAVDHNWDG